MSPFLHFAEAEEDELNDAKQELKHELNLEKCDRAHHWIGDGYCDDDRNNQICNYDGGDCCGPNVNTLFCFECHCFTG